MYGQFKLWRLVSAAFCFFVAFELAWLAGVAIQENDDLALPIISALVALAFVVAGVGMLVRRAGEFPLYMFVAILRLFAL